jgi:hypothetical protein
MLCCVSQCVPGCRALLKRLVAAALQDLDSAQRHIIYGLANQLLEREYTAEQVQTCSRVALLAGASP